MRRLRAPVALALALLASASRTPAQNTPAAEQFTTADGVRLKGLFHKAAKPAPGDPLVVLLYEPGPGNDMAKGAWAGLAAELNKAGYHVFRFDWRGHGKSTVIVNPPAFWANPWNQKHVRGANQKPAKAALDAKADFAAAYFPVYVNDLAAARFHLDLKNDAGVLSTSSVYLVGAGDAATLGMLWTAAEWHRPAVAPNVVQLGGAPRYTTVPQPLVGGVGVEAGADVAGAVWLSASRLPVIPDPVVKGWVMTTAPKLRANNPTLFLCGQQDAGGVRQSKFFYDGVMMAKGIKGLGVPPLDQTFLVDVKGTRLRGGNLLGNDEALGTETTVLKFLDAVQKGRAAVVPRRRNYTNPYSVNLTFFGL